MQAEGSAVSALAAWTAAGMPAHQIVLGVAGYGHSYYVDPIAALTSNKLNIYPAFNASEQPLGDASDNTTNMDVCGVVSGPSGVFDLWGLINVGFLNVNGSAANGIHYIFDWCSQSEPDDTQPFVYNQTSQVMVSFDNAQSFEAKGGFIAKNNLRGFAISGRRAATTRTSSLTQYAPPRASPTRAASAEYRTDCVPPLTP
ncbi:hypothetical protein EVJ58_g9592 [Rhodofomes roseus]|uniref:GH18 domain-containing protein n=1 Tax=Rhodofomes roseus TaxID=34475 RepID=A0A4Y9XTS9_9APHY|nr:hypothetical protein EVJ58_g9592 [Rhodofomes roseus]